MKKILKFSFVLLALVLPLFSLAEEKKIVSSDYTIGKAGQKVTPKEIKETIRPDGARSIVTGNTRDSKGKIGDPHSHSIVKDGQVVSSRTAGGRYVQKAIPFDEYNRKEGGGPLSITSGGGGGTTGTLKKSTN